jgi:hypothetical protein
VGCLARLRIDFPALLLVIGLSPCWAQTQGAATPLIAGTFELITWTPASPEYKFKETCSVAGSSVFCSGTFAVGSVTGSGQFSGTMRGTTMTGKGISKGIDRNPKCSLSYEHIAIVTIVLAPDGTQVTHASNGVTNYLSVSGACAPHMPKTAKETDTTTVGTWRQLTTGTDLTVTVTPDASSTDDAKVSVRIEGNTIYVTDGSGTERVVTVVPAIKDSPPTFSPPTVSGEAKAFEKYVMTHWYEASYGHLPPELRSSFVSGMPMPSDVAGEAAQAVFDAGDSAANWVRNNPADASLLVLSTAIGLAFPISAFANPTVAVGGAAVLRGVVGTVMVAGTTGFVQKLMSNVFTDQTATQRFKEAAAKGAGDAVASVPGSLAGAAFEKVAGQIVARTAVTAGSVGVGIATDKAMEKLQVSEKIAALVLKAPSYASSLLALPNQSAEPGGISLNFDR